MTTSTSAVPSRLGRRADAMAAEGHAGLRRRADGRSAGVRTSDIGVVSVVSVWRPSWRRIELWWRILHSWQKATLPPLFDEKGCVMRKMHLFLIHGTWGKKSPFLKQDSKLRRALDQIAGLQVHLHGWTGRQSFVARQNAANRLADDIRKLPESDPVFLLGHSHGGMIAHFAAQQLPEEREIGAVMTMSTPFIYSRPRPHAKLMAIALAVAVWMAVMMLLLFGLIHLTGNKEGDAIGTLPALGSIAVALVIAVTVFILFQKIADIRPPAAFGIFRTKTPRAICYRAPADEASLSMGFAQLIMWLSSTILIWPTFAAEVLWRLAMWFLSLDWLSRIAAVIRGSWRPRAAPAEITKRNRPSNTGNGEQSANQTQRPKFYSSNATLLGWIACAGFLVFSAYRGYDVFIDQQKDEPLPLAVFFAVYIGLMSGAIAALAVAGIGVILAFAISILAGLAFGPEAIVKAVFDEISVEACPPWHAEMVMVRDAPVGVSLTGMHSITYESDEVIEDICRRVRGYTEAPHERAVLPAVTEQVALNN